MRLLRVLLLLVPLLAAGCPTAETTGKTECAGASDCNDQNNCTADSCKDGACAHADIDTSDGDPCTADACDPVTGNVTHTVKSVDDGNACTIDSCNAASGNISHRPVVTSDNDRCTIDACDPRTGAISHTPVTIDDGNACTTDACDPGTGTVTHTGSPETCDGADNDCDGVTDEEGPNASTWYRDADGDGYGNPASPRLACAQPAGYVAIPSDCLDSSNAVRPGAPEYCNLQDDDCDGTTDESSALNALTWYADTDGDSYGNAAATARACARPFGYVANATDCNDGAFAVRPLAAETCDGVDSNCANGENDATDKATWYVDGDGDGHGSAASTVLGCDQPQGFTALADDCNDGASDVHPAAAETCNGVDSNCGSGENDASDRATWYADEDGDGHGDAGAGARACNQPQGYEASSDDCDDGDSDVHPGAAETCDGVDTNCADGEDDAADRSTWYADADTDGHGNPDATALACALPAGYVATGDDCNDLAPGVHSGAAETCDGTDNNCTGNENDASDAPTYYGDVDQDGYGSSAKSTRACALPVGHVANAADCDDSSTEVHPGADEACNSTDDDCDGSTDEDVGAVRYADGDGDGYGDPLGNIQACALPQGYADNPDDCDDGASEVHPGAAETCDGVDSNCADGESDASDRAVWYADGDQDGYGNEDATVMACVQPPGYLGAAGDCNDGASDIHPGAYDGCDGVNQDCDGALDEDGASVWHRDADSDGYGNAAETQLGCSQPAGFVTDGLDCDDQDAGVHPDQSELCNGKDDDCDGGTDVGATGEITWYPDADSDGHGVPGATVTACAQPAGHAATDDDCNDAAAAAYPGATEVCDPADLDENCDGLSDDASALGQAAWYPDTDGDGHGAGSVILACNRPAGYAPPDGTDCDDTNSDIYPGAAESCNAVDEDCDGQTDEGTGATWYRDADTDLHGDPLSFLYACSQPAGYEASSDDCDDAHAAAHPGGTEVCDPDNVDEDCDGTPEEAGSPGESTWYFDADSDAYGVATPTTMACDPPPGYAGNADDCDDNRSTVNPGENEVCDAQDRDEDCDAMSDEAGADGETNFYFDGDSDGYGRPTPSLRACDAPLSYVTAGGDCDDASTAVHPGAAEICSGADENCDAQTDEGGGSLCPETDGYACTAPACNGASGCSELADDGLCSDGVGCTADRCVGAGGNAAGCAFETVDRMCAPTQYCNAVSGCGTAGAGDQDGRVIVTEFQVFGSSGNVGELIELQNTTDSSIDIRGFSFADDDGGSAEIRAVTNLTGANTAPVVLPAGGYAWGIPNPGSGGAGAAGFVYGEAGTSFALDDGGDVLALYTAAGALEDLVNFTSFQSDATAAVGATQFVGFPGISTQLEPTLLSAAGNDSGANWCTSFYPASGAKARVTDTQGAANGSCKVAVINELLYDVSPTADDANVFVEIAGPGGMLLGGAKLEEFEGGTTGFGIRNTQGTPNPGAVGGQAIIPAGKRIPVDGLLIVADALDSNTNTTSVAGVTAADVLVRDMDIENSGDDSLMLISAGGTQLDVVGWNVSGGNTDSVYGFPMYETRPATSPPVNQSIGRNLASADSDNNSDDFKSRTPTPGAPNVGASGVTVSSLSPDDGLASAGNTGVTITGTEFGPGATATFGSNAPVPCTWVSTTQIVCDAPANGGAAAKVNVTVTNAAFLGGQSGMLPNGWTYTGVMNEQVTGEVDYCVLQFPSSLGTVSPGATTAAVYGQIYELGMTNSPGPNPAILAEIGYGLAGIDPTTQAGWRFFAADYNSSCSNCGANNDEYQQTLIAPATPGLYSYTARFSLDTTGLNWTYCDLGGAGANPDLFFNADQLGTLTVE